MNRFLFFTMGLFLSFLISSPVYATWQITAPRYHPKLPISEKLKGTHYPGFYGKAVPFRFQLHRGSLKAVMQDIADKYRWRLQWKNQTYWYVLSEEIIQGYTFQEMCRELLRNYPLRVVYNVRGRVVTVYPKQKYDRIHGHYHERHRQNFVYTPY